MNKTKQTAILVINTKTVINENILNAIRTDRGADTHIMTVRSTKAFTTPYGFANLVQPYTTKRNTAVYTLKTLLKGPTLKTTVQMGIPFNLLFKNRGNSKNWNSVNANRITSASPR